MHGFRGRAEGFKSNFWSCLAVSELPFTDGNLQHVLARVLLAASNSSAEPTLPTLRAHRCLYSYCAASGCLISLGHPYERGAVR